MMTIMAWRDSVRPIYGRKFRERVNWFVVLFDNNFSLFLKIIRRYFPSVQLCFYCKKKGASIGCCKPQCRKSFHLHCGIQNECTVEFLKYKSFCNNHVVTAAIGTHNNEEKCGLCSEQMSNYSRVNSMQFFCCTDDKWYHKMCVRKIAFEQGAHLKCPSCENSDFFMEHLLSNGIYISGTLRMNWINTRMR